jgi:uncharacterized protein YutE (UPF0331/DUF86 family)
VTTPEQEVLASLFAALRDVSLGSAEALEVLGTLSDRPEDLEQLSALQRLAARALLKCVEQMQDLLARSLRLILMLEQEDLEGMSARAIADRAESLGVIDSSDAWSALVRLRNRLAHEYPLGRAVQLTRLRDAVSACGDLNHIVASVSHYANSRGLLS